MNVLTQTFFLPLSPCLALVAAALALVGVECTGLARFGKLKLVLGFAGAFVSVFCCFWLLREGYVVPDFVGAGGDGWLAEFSRTFRYDGVSLLFFLAIGMFTLLSIVFVEAQFQGSDVKGEVLALMLFISAGMMLLVASDSLLMIFLALELLSLPTYVLVGLRRQDKNSCEAALKYFLFGSFASVLIVLASAVFYAAFGTLHLPTITRVISQNSMGLAVPNLPVLAGLGLFIVGLGFKIGVVPFHMWLPDTYQGAPTSVTGFMGSAVKLTGFGLAIRFFWEAFQPVGAYWSGTLIVVAVTTSFVGNLAALAQDNLKRLLAYSSVAHAGYLLLGVAAATPSSGSLQALYFYLVTYGFMFIGLFGILYVLERQLGSTEIFNVAGLGFSHPWLGGFFAIFLLSGAGIPQTAGFFAKYLLFTEVASTGRIGAMVLALISSLTGVYAYFRVLGYLYMREGRDPRVAAIRLPWLQATAIGLCATLMLYFSLYPIAFR